MAKEIKIVRNDGVFNILGEPLIVFYDEGDVDVIGPKSEDRYFHRALYDLYQVSDDIKEGDFFTLDNHKIAECVSVHVRWLGRKTA